MKKRMLFGIVSGFMLLAVAALILVTGCATTTGSGTTATVSQTGTTGTVTTSGITSMTPKQKAVFFGSFYKAQYDSYKAKQDTTMTDAERQVMRVRWQALTAMRPLLDTFNAYIDSGAVPPEDIMLKVMELYTQLAN